MSSSRGNKNARSMYQPIGGTTGDYYDDNTNGDARAAAYGVGIRADDGDDDEEAKYGVYGKPLRDDDSDDVVNHPYIAAARMQPDGDDDREYCKCGSLHCCACKTRRGCVISTMTVTLFILGLCTVMFFFVALPLAISRAIVNGDMQFVHVSMSNPIDYTIILSANGTLANVDTHGFSGAILPSTLNVIYNGDTIGTFPTQQIDVGPNSDTFQLSARMSVDDLDVFDRFSTDVIEQSSITLTISGKVRVRLVAYGITITVPDIPLNKDMVIQGFGGAPSIDVLNFEVSLTDSGEVKGIITANVFNPSIVDVTLGDINLDVWYKDAYISQCNATNVHFATGTTQLTLEGILRPSKIEPVNELIGRYISGVSSNMWARGSVNGSSSYPLFQRFLSNLTLPGTLQGPARSIGREVLLHVDISILVDWVLTKGLIVVPTQVLFHNPFNAVVNITGVEANVTYQNISVGYSMTKIDSSYHPLHIQVPANSTALSPEVPVALDTRGADHIHAEVKAIVDTLEHGYAKFGLIGKINITVGNLQLSPFYVQRENIPACLNAIKGICDEYVRNHTGSDDYGAHHPLTAQLIRW